MELRDIEYFAVVAEHRHLGRASEALGLSPTALSKSLRRLEKAMQAKLVTRTPKGVELTAEGDALLARVSGLRLSLDDVAREVADLAQGRVGHLRIGASPSIAVEILLVAAYAALMNAGQKITTAIRIQQTHATLPALRNGELDLVLSALPVQPDEDMVQESLIADDIVVIASANHPLTRQKKVTIADLAQQHWALTPSNSVTRRGFNQLFEAKGIPPPKPTLEISSAALTLRMVGASDLLCFVSRWCLNRYETSPGLVEIPAKEMKWRRHTGVSYRKGGYLSPVARRFIEILKTTAKEIAKDL